MGTKHNKKTFTLIKVIIIVAILILTCTIIMRGRNSETIGNTDEEVLNNITSSDLMDSIGKENISIVDNIGIEDSKIVGFKSDTGHGYAVYEKNKQGDFVMTDSAAQGISDKGIRASDFVVHYNTSNGLEHSEKAYISISEDKHISKVAMRINERTFITPFDSSKPAMVVVSDVDPITHNKDGVTYKCIYFDKNGKEIIE